jgi:hypothetical protein
VWDPRLGRKVLKKIDVPVSEAKAAEARWHGWRADGQRGRFESLLHCGEGAVRVSCTCGDETPAVLGCDVRRLCVRCRDHGAKERRERFARARAVLLHRSMRLGHLRRVRPGGRYSEKHLTLTIPDAWIVGEGAVGWRVTVLFAAWRRFSQRLVKWGLQ